MVILLWNPEENSENCCLKPKPPKPNQGTVAHAPWQPSLEPAWKEGAPKMMAVCWLTIPSGYLT